jgi:DNA (cytosine-5)-methyltransferase 1
MTKRRLLDLFCGAGGAAMGYSRAGFDVVGVDINPQPHYPFEFHQADAMEYPLGGFDAIHASPPCQAYSRLRHLPWLKGREYPELIDGTRARLIEAGVPWAMENVEDAPMPGSIVLCGLMFGLPLYRHRRFETHDVILFHPPHQKHTSVLSPGGASLSTRYRGSGGVTGVIKEIDRRSIAGHEKGVLARATVALGIDWMNRAEITQAIPPAYTEFIGRHLIAALAGGTNDE